MNGTPRDLLPGDPLCAPIRTVLAETTVHLVRSLSLHSMWKEHVVSAIVKGLQDIRSALLLCTDKEDGDKDSFKMNVSSSQTNQGNHTEDNNKVNTQVRCNKQSDKIIRAQVDFCRFSSFFQLLFRSCWECCATVFLWKVTASFSSFAESQYCK